MKNSERVEQAAEQTCGGTISIIYIPTHVMLQQYA